MVAAALVKTIIIDAPLGAKPGDSTMLALGNSGYGVVASANAIRDLIAAF